MLAISRIGRRAGLLSLASIGGAALIAHLGAQAPSDSPSFRGPSFQQAIQPFLNKNCLACHSAKLAVAGLDLQAYTDAESVKKGSAVWTKVLAKLKAGQMPPAGIPAPPKADVDAVTAWIQTQLATTTSAKPNTLADGDPGRVTLRRLNRAEFNNTIRDLLGVLSTPADEFPLDDSGYGFDNNGDVLSLSPLLMEKYISAAANLSQEAVYGPSLPEQPGQLVRIVTSTGPTQGLLPRGATTIILPYSIRGELRARYAFPKEGDYEFHFTPRDIRGLQQGPPLRPGAIVSPAAPNPPARGPRGGPPTPEQIEQRKQELLRFYPPVTWVFTIDGKEVVSGSHAGGYDIDQGATPETNIRVRLTAGEHALRISYPGLAELDDPLDNMLLNKGRALGVGAVDILGPYNPNAEPVASYKKIFVCGHAPGKHNASCTRPILDNLASRAFRRPATDTEIQNLSGLVSLAERQKKSYEEGIRMAVQAILLSPHFLFRVELDPQPRAALSGPTLGITAKPMPADTGVATASTTHPISDYELASRLSFFLWSSMPDDELIRAAKSNSLRKPGVIEAQVARMLDDPKSRALVENFAGQWLGLRELNRRVPDTDRFPRVDGDLLEYMQQETYLFVNAVLRENSSILDFIDGRFTYLNGPLAKHYGIAGVKGQEFQRVELDGEQRSGLLTQGSILAVSAFPTRTSVVTRGRWVLDNLLGTPPPPPPPDVPGLKDNDIGTAVTLRERMSQHRADPSCAACHNAMDPIGFSLEHYDASGAWRDLDGKFPIDASGTLPDGTSFNGAKELKQLLRSKTELFTHNLSEKMLTYGLGRGVEPYDKVTVDEIAHRVTADQYHIRTMILEVVKSKPFQMRNGAAQ